MRKTALLAIALTMSLLSAPVLAGPKGCPPGLAKKSVPCVPPGQAKVWQLGARLPANVAWYEVRDWNRYGLPSPLEGSRYVMVGSEILRIAIPTGIILDYLGAF